ncbi:hypothetical protein THH46_03535 [Pseudomonas sp. NA13]
MFGWRIGGRATAVGKRHGKHVEQHCEAGDPGKCKPLSGHGRIRSMGDQVAVFSLIGVEK